MLLTSLVLLGMIVCSQGLQLSMQRLPGNDVCGQLQCWNDVTPDGNIFSTTSISIYDVTQPEARTLLASISSNGNGFFINQSKVSDVSGSGSLSRYHANVTLNFRNNGDCVYGSFECELQFVTMDGLIDSLRQTASPASGGCSCSALALQVSQLSGRVGAVENEMAELRWNRSLLEEELAAQREFNNVLNNRLSFLSQQVTVIQDYINFTPVATTGPPATQAPIQPISSCSKGVSHTNSREKFLLWNKFPALCDTQTDGGGWVVIQRRTVGDVNFYQDWDVYKNGFGTPDTDFWIGNEIIHNLTSQSYNELRVDLVLNGVAHYAHYSVFNVDNEVLNYRMTVSGYSGNAGDSLTYHNGMGFSTWDRDHDRDSGNCALHHTSAWWYNSCYRCNLNGIWGKDAEGGVIWQGLSTSHSVTFTEMKLRHV
ncbi:hypothetical protein BsWGS_07073 [Bradybaena similaris]